MFKNPNIDVSQSIQMIVHVVKHEGEYTPVLELVLPDEDSLNLEMLFAMRDALDFSYKKIDKIIELI
jgi:hypothetical protein